MVRNLVSRSEVKEDIGRGVVCFLLYLATLSQLSTLCSIELLDEVERIWKEKIVRISKYISESFWRDWRKPWESQVRIGGIEAETSTRDAPNANQECQPLGYRAWGRVFDTSEHNEAVCVYRIDAPLTSCALYAEPIITVIITIKMGRTCSMHGENKKEPR
jgi:hypothetical protein